MIEIEIEAKARHQSNAELYSINLHLFNFVFIHSCLITFSINAGGITCLTLAYGHYVRWMNGWMKERTNEFVACTQYVKRYSSNTLFAAAINVIHVRKLKCTLITRFTWWNISCFYNDKNYCRANNPICIKPSGYSIFVYLLHTHTHMRTQSLIPLQVGKQSIMYVFMQNR